MSMGALRYTVCVRLALAAMTLLLLSVLPSFAQQPVGSISGTVMDPSGGVVPGATVTATSQATGAARTTITNESGFFLISTLLPGEYKLTIEMTGFGPFTAEHVIVEVGQTARVDAKLQVKQIGEVVQVVGAGAAVVDTSQSTVGGVVNVRQIDELPLNGRNFLELARLQPGIEIQEGSAFDPTKSRYTGVSIAGRLGREARITVDGVDAVDEHVGTTTINISQDSIQEFQVSTSGADSSTGLSGTGAINIITRRGSNDIHGTGFVFGRGSRYAARPGLSPDKPPFDREQWGFNAGGPLSKDKLFWFANYEQTRERSAIGIRTAYFPILTSYPAPFDERSSTARLDWHLPRQNEFFTRWSRNDNSNFGGFGGRILPSSGNVNKNFTNQFVWGLDSVLSPKLVNGFRAAYTDFKNRVVSPPEAARKITVRGTEGFRIVTNDGLLIAGPDSITPQSTFERFGQFRDDITYSTGNHTLRFGADIVRRRVTVTNFVFGFPSMTVVGLPSRNPDDLLDARIIDVNIGNRNGKRIPGTPDNSHRNTRFSGYASDSWRIRQNFTLNLGLRYEVDSHPINNDLAKPDLARTLLPLGTAPTPINKHNFAPQFGFAWDPFKDGKTSIRGGFGIYYAMRISNLVTNERATLAPFNSGNDTITLTPCGTPGCAVFDFSRGGGLIYDFTNAVGTPGNPARVRDAMPVLTDGQRVYVTAPPLTVPAMQITRTGLLISNDLKTPYSQQFNVGFQRELPMNSVLDINFIYSRTVHEFIRDIDAANFFPGNGPPIRLGDGSLPNRAITVVRSEGFSRYRALTAKLDKRFANRYQFTASYALARVETAVPDGLGLGGGALVNRNVKANFGPSALDRTHRFTFNGIVDLPYGFRLSLISTINSALPISALVPADLNGDGITGDLLPGTHRGSLGREITSIAGLNALIREYNATVAGTRLPRGGNAPFLAEVPAGTRFGDTFISQDLQLSKIFRITERLRIEGTAQLFNILNVSNLVGPGGLPSSAFNNTLGSGFGSLSATRPSIPTGTGLPRAAQFGLRVSF
jgi:hypothetical protein